MTAPTSVRRRWARKAATTRHRHYLAACRRAKQGLSSAYSGLTGLRQQMQKHADLERGYSKLDEGVRSERARLEAVGGPPSVTVPSEVRALPMSPRTEVKMLPAPREEEKPFSPRDMWPISPNPGFSIRAGDRVTFVDRFGKKQTGRAVMPSLTGGWVLNMGGRHGTPALADSSNIVAVSGGRRSRTRARNPELLVVTNPGGRRAKMRRRNGRRRKAVRVGGKRLTWKGLVRRFGVKAAAKKWRGAKAANPRRRRRRNTWFGQPRRHARAARKGWRRRRGARGRRRYGRRRRSGCRRRTSRRRCVYAKRPFKGAVKYHGKFYSRRTLINKIGKKRLRKLFKRRGRRLSFNRGGHRRKRHFRRRR